MSSNSDYLDSLEMQESFEKLPEELKLNFVKYAVLNYGLKFGVKNYSMFIPAEYLKPVDDYLNKMDAKLRSNRVGADGIVLPGELQNIKENFMLRLAVNNVDKLPFISTKPWNNQPGLKPIPTPEKFVSIPDGMGGTQITEALDGMEEYYYNRKYANPINPESEKGDRMYSNRFPKFIRNGSNVALVRLNSVENDFVYYQKVGMQNWAGGYDASTEALAGTFTMDKYFGKQVIPIGVSDVAENVIQTRNEYLKVGSKVIIHAYNNESRDQGRFGIVTELRSDIGDASKKAITVRNLEESELTPAQEQFLTRYNPIMQMLTRKFNVPVKAVTNREMVSIMGDENVKGAVKEGVAYINMDLATLDTPFHEIAHPLIDAIRMKNPAWYQELVQTAKESPRWADVRFTVNQRYGRLTPEQKEVEILVTMLGELAANKNAHQGKLKTLLLRLLRQVGAALKEVMKAAGVINLDTLSNENMALVTLNDLAEIMANKDAAITLDLSGFAQYESEQKQLNTLEERFVKEGRIILTCKL
jgi:hypothetical protein